MVKSKLVRATAVAAASFGLVASLTGIAGASTGSGTISGTGPDSSAKVVSINKVRARNRVSNNLFLLNQSDQFGHSGPAIVAHNTTGGGATSGAVSDANTTGATLNLSNTTPSVGGVGGGGASSNTGSITNTGPSSSAKVVGVNEESLSNKVKNNVALVNTSDQVGKSGPAVVAGNTTGGSASSGAVTETNSSTFSVTITNH